MENINAFHGHNFQNDLQERTVELMIYSKYLIHYQFSPSSVKMANKITCFFSGHSYLPLGKEQFCSRCLKNLKTK